MTDQPREVVFRPAPCIRQQYRSLLIEFPGIAETIKTFNDNKRAIPPIPLPHEMRDHKLSGALKGIRECHLADDVLLLYEHEDDVVRMLYICRHKDLYGKRAKQIATKIGESREQLDATTQPKQAPT